MEVMERLVGEIERKFAEVERTLEDPTLPQDQRRFAEVGRQYARLNETMTLTRRWREAQQQVEEAQELLEGETDADTRDYLHEQLESARAVLPDLEEQIRVATLERDPADDKNVIVEIRAGTGGEEAALFAADLYGMLTKYAARLGFKTQELSASPSDSGGFKDVTFEITGDAAYSIFKWESGVHRVQRVPATETQGRIHTSTATVAVLPEAEEVEVHVDPKDVHIDVFRATGPGGQSVNTTDSAVRLTHAPTGIVVACQDERSQLQNKERAWRILRARIYDRQREQQAQEVADARRSQIGSGSRSEKVRTYNFPQSRITDHRVKHTSHALDQVLQTGELEGFTEALQADWNRRRLEESVA
jgi:peptide chain release factor 1